MKDYIDGKDKGKKTKNGLKYYEEFKLEFWKKPGKYQPYMILIFFLSNFR